MIYNTDRFVLKHFMIIRLIEMMSYHSARDLSSLMSTNMTMAGKYVYISHHGSTII
jgi:hypothetical protein